MSDLEPCAFCDLDSLSDRIIRVGAHTVSLLSKPAYRPGHALIIPRRHITTLSELSPAESVELLGEASNLEERLDTGLGAEVHQKFIPQLPNNGVSMKHLHFHVVPKLEADVVFGVPSSFDDFYIPTDEEIAKYLSLLR